MRNCYHTVVTSELYLQDSGVSSWWFMHKLAPLACHVTKYRETQQGTAYNVDVVYELQRPLLRFNHAQRSLKRTFKCIMLTNDQHTYRHQR